ncbi:MAG: IS110 family transposase [Bacteroidia bacterium]|jgi:transposase|nr:IS110 family transposase [Bacteroidia bacterium]
MSVTILGIDIAKQKFDVALLADGKTKHKACKNSAEGFEILMIWLERQGIQKVHACLEATGNYGEDLAVYLHEAGHTVSIVNPARVKGFAQSELIRTKTDKIDAGVIARFCLAMKPEPWVPPSPEIRSLRALVRRVDSLIDMRSQEKNRISTAHESVVFLIKEHIAYLDQEIEKIRKQIADLIGQNPQLKQRKELLDSIPGLGKATIPHLLAELDNLDKFTHVREMVAFIGLAPKETLSGSSIKGKPRLCKIGHARLRKALYMPALVSIQCNPVMITFYNRLKEKGKNGKVIVCAIMRKLVHVIFGVLKSGKKYDPNYKPAFA